MAEITKLDSLKINLLTNEQYKTAKEAGEIDLNQLYMITDEAVGELFYVTYETTTYAEITAALIEGRFPVCVYSATDKTLYLPYSAFIPDVSYVFSVSTQDGSYEIACASDDTWTIAEIKPTACTIVEWTVEDMATEE